MIDLQAIRALASGIARQAGAELMRLYEQPHEISAKRMNVMDIVTEGDRASEAVIVAALRQHFPDHHIVGEEGGGMGAPPENAEYFWYVDPIDGTNNFASNLPLFSVSIAMADRSMKPLVGVVLNPVYDELYSAARGFGASLNDRPLRVSGTDMISQAMLSTGFPHDRQHNADNNLREWNRFLMRTRSVLRLGSAALDLAFVAAGRLDGFWEPRLKPWDVQAGLLLVEEAGGKITDYSGECAQQVYSGAEVVASNGLIHGQMLNTLAEGENAPAV